MMSEEEQVAKAEEAAQVQRWKSVVRSPSAGARSKPSTPNERATGSAT